MVRKFSMVAAVALVLLPLPAMAAGFDVERATRAYLDTLQGAARAKSDAYFEGGYWLILWGTAISMLSDWLLLRFRLSSRFRDWGEKLFKRRFGITWLTGLAYTLAGWLITLPWTIYKDFVREGQYGLMNQTFMDWSIDLLKALGVSLVLFPLFIAAIYAVIRRFPRRWWLAGTGLVGLFFALGMLLGPVYIAPLFNKYTELPAGPVRDRIVAMARSRDVPAEHIYLVDASKQSKRISANVSGIGPTIRISLNDNLLNRSTPAEIAAVMGHEMGHYKLNHAWIGFACLTLLAALELWLASRMVPWLLARYGARWGVRDIADPASLPVLGIALAVLGLLATPLTNSLIRMDESAADAYGLDVSREPDAEASVDMKLSEYRKIEPGWLEEILFYDHPSGAARVRMAMQWKKDHVPNAVMVVPPPMPQEGLKPE